MKSILHLKDDTEYQIPLRETGDRAKVGTTEAEKAANKKKVNDREKATATQSQDDPTAKKKTNEISREEVTDEEEAAATQSQDDSTANKKTEEISQKEVNNKEGVNNKNDSALDGLEDETQNQEPSNTGNSSNDTTTESVPQADTAKAALDEMKKLASQDGVIHPSLFISNFSKILGLMERAMQLQVKESGSATEESDSATEEKAPETIKQTEVPEKTEAPAEGK